MLEAAERIPTGGPARRTTETPDRRPQGRAYRRCRVAGLALPSWEGEGERPPPMTYREEGAQRDPDLFDAPRHSRGSRGEGPPLCTHSASTGRRSPKFSRTAAAIATGQAFAIRQRVLSGQILTAEDKARVLRRRDYARTLLTDNPQLAKELNIGRPDLHSEFDDGGLIDVNHVSESFSPCSPESTRSRVHNHRSARPYRWV